MSAGSKASFRHVTDSVPRGNYNETYGRIEFRSTPGKGPMFLVGPRQNYEII